MVSPSTDAFKTGNRFNARTAASTKNGVTVSFAPGSAFDFSRAAMMLEQSTSKNVVTCAEVRRLIIMCSEIDLRMALMGTRSTSPDGPDGPDDADGPGAGAALR